MKYKPLCIYVGLLFAITLFMRIALISYYNSSLGGVEQNVIYGIQRILLGQPLYQDPTTGSMAIIQYTPLWYYLIAGVAHLVSPTSYHHGLDVQGIYILSRIIALSCNLLTICICALIIRAWRFSWFHSIMFSLPVLLVLTAHFYTRGDSLYLLLFVLSVYGYICFCRKEHIAYLIAAAVCSAACIMTKQSGMLVAGIIIVALMLKRRVLPAALYSATFIVSSFLIAHASNNGDWHSFYQNAVLGLRNGFNLSFLCNIFTSRFFLDLVPCYMPAAMMLKKNKTGDHVYRFLVASMGCSWLYGVITGLKVGSSNNYFTEFLLLLIIALPYYLQQAQAGNIVMKLFNRPVTYRRFAILALLILVTSKTTGMFTALYIEKNIRNDPEEYAREQKLYDYFVHELHIQSGQNIFFTGRKYLDNVFVNYAVMPTKDVISEVFLADSSTFRYQPFAKSINNGDIQYIVADSNGNDINACNNSLPFIFFDKSKFKGIARVSQYIIYTFNKDK